MIDATTQHVRPPTHRYYGGTTPKFRFKVYEDVVVYFSYIASIAVLATVAHLNPTIGKTLNRRRLVVDTSSRAPSIMQALDTVNPFKFGVSVGEAVLVLSWLGLAAWWVYFFAWSYPRVRDEATSTAFDSTQYPACCPPGSEMRGTWCVFHDPHAMLGLAARVAGELSTFIISFAIYPVSRNSIFSSVFGVGYDQVCPLLLLMESALCCCFCPYRSCLVLSYRLVLFSVV